MNAINEVLNWCNEFTFFDHYNIERVTKLNHVRDYTIHVLADDDSIN